MKYAFLVITLCATTASAQPAQPDVATRARAASMFERGSAHYEAGRYSKAIPLFQNAYELVHDPVYLFNLAQSYRKVLDCERATAYYTRFLKEAKDVPAEARARVRGWLRELAPCVKERRAAAETARRAQEQAARARREAAAARRKEPSDRTVDRGRWYRVGGYLAMGAGAIGIGLGVRYGMKGADLEDELATACATGCNWSDPELRDKDDAGKRANTLSTTFWIGGGVALAGGVALYLVGRSKVERVQLVPVEGGAAVSARLTF